MNVLAIVQARMGSTRLPGKVMKELCDIPVLMHVVRRIKKSRIINNVIVATTIKEEDNIIVDLMRKEHVDIFRGSEEDVLDRYYLAAKENNADIVVRVTSDDPLIDFNIIDDIVEKLITEKLDYCCNNMPRTYPLGLDCECFTFNALKIAWRNAKEKYDREHVTPFIRENSNLFKISSVKNDKDFSNLRWTLDTLEDYNYIKNIYENLYYLDNYFTTSQIIDFLANMKCL